MELLRVKHVESSQTDAAAVQQGCHDLQLMLGYTAGSGYAEGQIPAEGQVPADKFLQSSTQMTCD